jgi:hypothetical protein
MSNTRRFNESNQSLTDYYAGIPLEGGTNRLLNLGIPPSPSFKRAEKCAAQSNLLELEQLHCLASVLLRSTLVTLDLIASSMSKDAMLSVNFGQKVDSFVQWLRWVPEGIMWFPSTTSAHS